jgi:hypothetical protein
VLICRRATVEPDRSRLFTCGRALLVSLPQAVQADAFVVVVRLSVTAELAVHAHTSGEDLCMPIYFFSLVCVPSHANHKRHACMYVLQLASKANITSFATLFIA